jgi:CRP-like cAMP-binding protein/predicted Ser/Thr protein kinase
MTDWNTVSRVCREALSRDTDDRPLFLDRACAGNPGLRQDVDSLLEPLAGPDTCDRLLLELGALWNETNSTTDPGGESTREETAGERSHRILFKSSPFSVLGAETLDDLLSVMHLREFEAGAHLMQQGDPAGFLLLVLTGYATARVRDVAADRPPVGEFGPGDVVGEMSLVTDEPRVADVVARTHARALQLSSEDFHVLADKHPDLRVVLTEVVADRLGRTRYDGLGGKDVHGYRIVQCVGRGGMGVVYEATQVATGRQVALKMMNHRLTYQLSARRRFRRESAILASLDHPSLARVYESFSAYKTEFLAMEYCQGQTLSQLISARGPLLEELVRRLLGQLAVALAYVHGQGIVHRDLKPANVVLTERGAIKLIDFGIVMIEPNSDLWPALKTTSLPAGLIGTPRYMAPEQFSDRVTDRRADFYGLACVGFEALSGRPVVASTDAFDVIREQAHFILPPREQIGAGVSQELYDVLAGGLEHDPDKRVLDLDALASWAAPVHLDS